MLLTSHRQIQALIPPSQLVQDHMLFTNRLQPCQNIKVESIPDLVTYTPPVDVASSPNNLGVYDDLFDAGLYP